MIYAEITISIDKYRALCIVFLDSPGIKNLHQLMELMEVRE